MPTHTVTTSVDLKRLTRRLQALDAATLDEVDRTLGELTEVARDSAVDLINAQIYDTPERGYERTGALRASIYSRLERARRGRWRVVLGAVGGAGGRAYALYNERGTYAGRVSLDSIREAAERAKVQAGLIRLQYGDPASGLEPRPWTIPTMVLTARYFPPLFLGAVKRAQRT